MKTRDLAEYLSGRAKLTENHTSNSASAPLWTGRQERLQQNWRDATVKMEALFLDVLDASEAALGNFTLVAARCSRTSEDQKVSPAGRTSPASVPCWQSSSARSRKGITGHATLRTWRSCWKTWSGCATNSPPRTTPYPRNPQKTRKIGRSRLTG